MAPNNADDPNARKGVAQVMTASFVLMIIASLGLAVIITRIGSVGWTTGLKVGLVAGLCFSPPPSAFLTCMKNAR